MLSLRSMTQIFFFLSLFLSLSDHRFLYEFHADYAHCQIKYFPLRMESSNVKRFNGKFKEADKIVH